MGISALDFVLTVTAPFSLFSDMIVKIILILGFIIKNGLFCESILLPSERKLLVISDPDFMAASWHIIPHTMCYEANVIDIYDENQECEGIKMPCYFGPIGTMLEENQPIICGSLNDPRIGADPDEPVDYPFNCTLIGTTKNSTTKVFNLKYSHQASSAVNINGSALWITGMGCTKKMIFRFSLFSIFRFSAKNGGRKTKNGLLGFFVLNN